MASEQQEKKLSELSTADLLMVILEGTPEQANAAEAEILSRVSDAGRRS